MSLKQKTITSLSWSALSQLGKQSIQFIITAVLARLISPTDFGLIGMATVFTQFAATIGETGVTGALIQRRNVDNEHYSTVFWLNLGVGLLLFAIGLLCAPLVAVFYKTPALKPIMIGIAFAFPVASIGVVQQAILMKELHFKQLMFRDIAAVFAGGACGIWMALNGFGAWSLVGQLLMFTLVNSIALWFFSSWRPAFVFSKRSLDDLIGFSANMTGFAITNYIGRNVDYLLIGKFLGSEALGLYTLAYKLMLVPLQNVSWVITRVMFPAFSKIQHDSEAVCRNYLKLIRFVSLITFPMMAVLSVLAPDLIHDIYGDSWQGAVLPIQILSFCGMVQSLTTIGGTLYQSQGRADLQFRMGVANALLTTLVVSLTVQRGLIPLAAAYTTFSIIWSVFSLIVCSNIISLDIGKVFKSMVPAILVAAVLGGGLVAMRLVLGQLALPALISVSLAGIIAYGFLFFFIEGKTLSFLRFNKLVDVK